MSRISDAFDRLRQQGSGALVTFVTAGDPDLNTTVELVLAMADAEVDVVELGIPFSDPVADGPTIQAASQRALAAGTKTAGILKAAGMIRQASEIPILFMTYCNLVYKAGYRRFAEATAEVGVDGVLISDLPVEESDDWVAEADRCALDTIFLLAPTSRDETIRAVAERSKGFIYCVSRTGVTGARDRLPPDLPDTVRRIRAAVPPGGLPVCVGFGISTADQVREVCRIADGAVVGSAIVRLAERCSDRRELVSQVGDLCRSLKGGCSPQMNTDGGANRERGTGNGKVASGEWREKFVNPKSKMESDGR